MGKYAQFTGFPVVDSVLAIHGATNILVEADTIQFDLSPGDSVVLHLLPGIADAVKGSIPTRGYALFPNPAKSEFTIKVLDPAFRNKPFSIEIIDLKGKTFPLYEKQNMGNGSFLIRPPASLKPGLYNIRVLNGNTHQTFPLEWIPTK